MKAPRRDPKELKPGYCIAAEWPEPQPANLAVWRRTPFPRMGWWSVAKTPDGRA